MVPILGMAEEKPKKGSKESAEEKKEEEEEAVVYKNHHRGLVDLICNQTGICAKSILDMDVYLYDMNVRLKTVEACAYL